MEWLGLGPRELSVVLGASVLSTLALYLLRPRRRTVVVPHLGLFEAIRAERRASAWLSRRIRILSLLLALAIVLSLGVALGDPRQAAGPRTGRTTVILVDRSASMGATDVRPTRLEEAAEAVRRHVRSLGRGDRICLVAVDHRATPLAPCTDDEATLLAALDGLQPLAVHEEFGHAFELAGDLLADAARPEVLVVSDGASRPTSEILAKLPRRARVSQRRVGRSGDNVAIAAFAARRHPVDRTESEVLVELENPSDVERTVELLLSGDGRALDVSRLAVPARGRVSRILRAVAGVETALGARIRPVDGRPDALAMDDVAHAVVPPRAKVRVLAVTRDDLYLEAALLLDEHLEIETTDPTRYDPTHARAHDVIVFDSFVPPEAPGRPAIYLHPVGTGPYRPFDVRGSCERPFFERVERSERLLRYVALDDVNVAESPVIRPAAGDRVLGADPRCPLLLRGTRDGQPFLALSFDPRGSDLPLRPAWPMLLLRAIEELTDQGGDFVSGYETGQAARVPFAGEVDHVTVRTPSGRAFSAPVQDGRVVFVPVEAGVHRLRAGAREVLVAANLASAEERRLAPSLLPGVRPATAPSTRLREASLGGAPWRWLAGLAFALLLFEWLAHHRRWTV